HALVAVRAAEVARTHAAVLCGTAAGLLRAICAARSCKCSWIAARGEHMPRFVIWLLAFALLGAPAANAEKRVALVIGNSAYQNAAELKNSRNDASDMAKALRRLGFDLLDGLDLDKRSMERTIREFGIKLSGADLAFFYYAGHGVAIGGQNYLVPTDAR